MTDGDGYAIESTVLPTCLKQAHAEATFRLSVGTELMPDGNAGENVESESKSIGSMSKSVTYAGVKDATPTFPLIDRLLSPLLNGSPTGFGSKRLELA